MEGIKSRLQLSQQLAGRRESCATAGGCPEAGGSGEGEGLAIAQIYILFLPHSARVTDEPERIGGPEVTR